jgi:NTP pyrophosphatase (non-canonical NTP hydrolase)
VLGIAGEAGDLATLFKKKLRDGDGFTIYPQQCAEELGDILWYLANTSRRLGFRLEDLAEQNLQKIKARWVHGQVGTARRPFLDAQFTPRQRLPRVFEVTFRESTRGNRKKVTLLRGGKRCGDPLTDNAYFEDGYRFHDIFHLAYATILGWSPVTRKLFRCKRRSNRQVDEIEDGGRATVIEEGIAALVFQYAEKHNLLDGLGHVDSELLSSIKRLTDGLEIRVASAGEWEIAILEGYRVFRLLNRHNGGVVVGNLIDRRLVFRRH